jgi:hypothetical protein
MRRSRPGRPRCAAEHEAALNRSIAIRTRLTEERRAHVATLSRPLPPEPPRAHISRAHQPRVADQERRTRFLRLWAAASTPLLLACIVVVLTSSPLAWSTTIVVLAVVFIGVEAMARRRFLSFLASALLLAGAIGLTVAFALVFREHWRIAVSVLLGAAALALLAGNLRDMRLGRIRERRSRDEAED